MGFDLCYVGCKNIEFWVSCLARSTCSPCVITYATVNNIPGLLIQPPCLCNAIEPLLAFAAACDLQPASLAFGLETPGSANDRIPLFFHCLDLLGNFDVQKARRALSMCFGYPQFRNRGWELANLPHSLAIAIWLPFEPVEPMFSLSVNHCPAIARHSLDLRWPRVFAPLATFAILITFSPLSPLVFLSPVGLYI